MPDYLALLPETQVAAWYRRLADRISKERIDGYEPMASTFLRHWLDNRDPASTFRFQAPPYLKQSSYVIAATEYHRRVFLTEEQARFTGRPPAWAGVVPRLQGRAGFTRWDHTAPLDMQYESLVEVGAGALDILRIQHSGTAAERDLLTALRGFQLSNRVTVRGEGRSAWHCGARDCPTQHDGPTGRCVPGTYYCGRRQPPCPGHGQREHNCESDGLLRVTFTSWSCRVRDRYDWDYNEYFTVPNPDYGSTAADAVRPRDKEITVYHRNAGRVEKANLAAPFDLESDEWPVIDARIIGPAKVDPARAL